MMAQIGQERWKEYKKNIVPVENKYMGNVQWMGTPEAADMSSGLATSGVRKQADAVLTDTENSMRAGGVNPDSAAYKMKVADINNKISTGLADADVSARTQQKNEYFKGLEGIVGIGNNQAAQAIGNTSDIANMSRDRAITNAEMNMKESSAVGNAVGTAAGLGIGAYGRKYGGR
jgi:hypothetical protein